MTTNKDRDQKQTEAGKLREASLLQSGIHCLYYVAFLLKLSAAIYDICRCPNIFKGQRELVVASVLNPPALVRDDFLHFFRRY
ncbi:hypothetical protein VNO77_41803 [Canavalia gladiata]|uniref:Uncharacterized protein n=1 Tax=Canavalia gladiata TaxID=3824 RepID=A0AAN9K1I7_CANGL